MGSTASVRVPGPRSWQAMAAATLASMPVAVWIAPLGAPVVPEV